MTEEFQLDYSEIQKTVERLLPDNFPITFEELIKFNFNKEIFSSNRGDWE